MAKYLIIFSLLIVIFLVQSSAQIDNKVFGGSNAKEDQFPYMVDLSVLYRGKFYHICGGVLIHYHWILTAGHCAYLAVKHNLRLNVTLGVIDITNGPHKFTYIIAREDIKIHENYSDDGDTAVNDVALLRVRQTILYGAKVLPIRLPSQSTPKMFENEPGILSGWGLNLNRKEGEPNVLQYIEETILSNEECTAQNSNYPKIVESEICISSQNGKTACQGDSGSPLVVRNDTVGDILVGIASYVDIGEVCSSDHNGPVVFMRVSYFMDWIENKTGLKFNN